MRLSWNEVRTPAAKFADDWEGGHPGRHAGWKPALLKEERDALHNIVICSGRLADPPRRPPQPCHQPPILPLSELHESGLKFHIS